MTTTTTTADVDNEDNNDDDNNDDDKLVSLPSFIRKRHVQYFLNSLLRPLPSKYQTLDTSRMTLVHFCIHALDLLGILNTDDTESNDDNHNINIPAIRQWIYSLRQQQDDDDDDDGNGGDGFCGGTFLVGTTPTPAQDENDDSDSCTRTRNPYAHSHIAMTYAAIATLSVLGDDDLSTVINVNAIVTSLKTLQRPNGSFQAYYNNNNNNSSVDRNDDTNNNMMESEEDLRFVYCACAISYMINDWSGVNKDTAVRYIRNCVSYDGALSLVPGQEGHGGSTFCGVASLVLMDKLHVMPPSFVPNLTYWCVSRQQQVNGTQHDTTNGGMQGRPNKLEDTCYSYWIGGTLCLLGQQRLLQQRLLTKYVLTCQSQRHGGFGKVIGVFPDVLHSFYSMAWLSMATNNNNNNNGTVIDDTKDDDDDDDDVSRQQLWQQLLQQTSLTTADDDDNNNAISNLKALNCTLGIRQDRVATVFYNDDGTNVVP